ncbi:hypothetical protein [Treponema pedis]|uniref:Uncharacterized protein n=1 Tax=Treponema pedis str. T A4 TaxID=1291379 RepID=S5ZR01_9SPIR|nr:hypothetical protein [Treponema pedis]AGT45087.1 hypothetical protein TPE_2615 [Treponema pedis str. T A4]
MHPDFLVCTCKCRIWNDIPNTKDKARTRFKCIRCGRRVRLVTCKHCGSKDSFEVTKGISKKSGIRPIYRFKCKSCGNELGIFLDYYEESEVAK